MIVRGGVACERVGMILCQLHRIQRHRRRLRYATRRACRVPQPHEPRGGRGGPDACARRPARATPRSKTAAINASAVGTSTYLINARAHALHAASERRTTPQRQSRAHTHKISAAGSTRLGAPPRNCSRHHCSLSGSRSLPPSSRYARIASLLSLSPLLSVHVSAPQGARVSRCRARGRAAVCRSPYGHIRNDVRRRHHHQRHGTPQ